MYGSDSEVAPTYSLRQVSRRCDDLNSMQSCYIRVRMLRKLSPGCVREESGSECKDFVSYPGKRFAFVLRGGSDRSDQEFENVESEETVASGGTNEQVPTEDEDFENDKGIYFLCIPVLVVIMNASCIGVVMFRCPPGEDPEPEPTYSLRTPNQDFGVVGSPSLPPFLRPFAPFT